jgi:hypothetical protein
VHFEITHEFDVPLDALELALISPSLFDRLSAQIASKAMGIESIHQKEHTFKDGILERVWSYQMNVKLPSLSDKPQSKEVWVWDEKLVYKMGSYSCAWSIVPNVKAEWQRFFSATGEYTLVSTAPGKSKRVVSGEIEVNIPFVRQLAERMVINEVKKTFEAEAATLRDLATLS